MPEKEFDFVLCDCDDDLIVLALLCWNGIVPKRYQLLAVDTKYLDAVPTRIYMALASKYS